MRNRCWDEEAGDKTSSGFSLCIGLGGRNTVEASGLGGTFEKLRYLIVGEVCSGYLSHASVVPREWLSAKITKISMKAANPFRL